MVTRLADAWIYSTSETRRRNAQEYAENNRGVKMSQTKHTLKYLEKYKTISKSESLLAFSCKDVTPIISALRKQGYCIVAHRNREDRSDTIYELHSDEWRLAHVCEHRYTEDTNPRLHNVWSKMLSRCYWKKHKSYADYGGRGITVCPEWYDSFQTFAEWALQNGYDEQADFMACTIDRIDVNGNYEPSNCRFVSMKEQCNNRRNNRILSMNGESHTLTEWSNLMGIPHDTIMRRIKNGWCVEDALTRPVRVQKNNAAKNVDAIQSGHNTAITFGNTTHTITEWEKITGISRTTIKNRLKQGMSVEDALTLRTRRSGHELERTNVG